MVKAAESAFFSKPHSQGFSSELRKANHSKNVLTISSCLVICASWAFVSWLYCMRSSLIFSSVLSTYVVKKIEISNANGRCPLPSNIYTNIKRYWYHRRSVHISGLGGTLYSNLGKTMENTADCILSGAFPNEPLILLKSHRPPMIRISFAAHNISARFAIYHSTRLNRSYFM